MAIIASKTIVERPNHQIEELHIVIVARKSFMLDLRNLRFLNHHFLGQALYRAYPARLMPTAH
jgi:hypothetical protein